VDDQTTQTVQQGTDFTLVVQTISKPDATLEVKTVEIPLMVQAEITKNLAHGMGATKKDATKK
jgi:hypothetical protein